MNLNEKQEQAKKHIDGPLLIIAWAGSWKTATLISRVEYMIDSVNISPESIIMLTFTNKAASEMRERLAHTLWISPPRNLFSSRNFPLIGTFHSLGIFFLKQMLASSYSEEVTRRISLKKKFYYLWWNR